MKHTIVITGSILLLALFQNCSKASFNQDESSSNWDNGALGQDGNGGDYSAHLNQPNTNPNSCYTVLHQTTGDVRMLFVVDTSGSNSSNEMTDPNKTLRGGSIQTFFNDYKSKTNFTWGFNYFSGGNANALIGSNSNPQFSPAAAMQSAMTAFYNLKDKDATPYQAAFDLAAKTIQKDTGAAAATKWIVVFLSDGLPNPTMTDAQLLAGVKSVVNLKPGQITFNTIYYGPNDAVANNRLKIMANQGGGYYLDTNLNPTAKDFLISNVVNVPGEVCEH